jgi:predicted flap endonuclease-1-like 5' DNA nuclease
MIWHFLEVWLLLAIAFAIGCALGAYLYGFLADSQLALVQGAVADRVGDGLDRIKAALGVGPAWRSRHLSAIERPLPPEAEIDDSEDAGASYPEPQPARHESPRAAEREARRIAPAERPERDAENAPAEGPEFAGDPQRIESAQAVSADGVVPMRPAGLAGPRGGVPDSLTRIRGVGERNEALLNSLGIYHFGQIAAWTPGEMRWIGQYLAFPERIARDDWVGQAMVLGSGGETGFEKSAERRRRRRHDRKAEIAAREVATEVADVMGAGKTPSAIQPPRPDEEEGDDD